MQTYFKIVLYKQGDDQSMTDFGGSNFMGESINDIKLNLGLPEQFIKVKENDIIQFIKLIDIIMIQAESNYSTIILASGHQMLTSKTLKHWSQKIGLLHPDFERIHRSFLINKRHVTGYKPLDRCLLMTGDKKVKIARSIKFYK
ncbi:MAG TPA: LytTR family DNA-binding domain-containing protein [Saprospiraceae bacterium]|nr:LytTR family DNA-binding domain-containing protein [Saprospiraceae bacterium]